MLSHPVAPPLHGCRKQEPNFKDLDISFRNPLEPGQGLPAVATYDLVITMDAVHDMARPDKVVSLVRRVRLRQSASSDILLPPEAKLLLCTVSRLSVDTKGRAPIRPSPWSARSVSA